jgi:hypothetical protein
MIIYGSRSSHLGTKQLTNEKCPHCGTVGSLIMSTYAKYAHVFWIPIFPLGRTGVSQCQHCKQVLEVKQMPPNIRQYHEVSLAENRIPLWQFSGLALLMVLIAWTVYSSGKDKEEQAVFLASPAKGDVYEMKTEAGNYTLFKIVAIADDSVNVVYNDFEVTKLSGINKIDKDENYPDSIYYSLSLGELKAMFEKGKIMDINRNPR